jgi:glycerol-3-phosphate dehydrogenase (NAD(P)+)
VTVAVLGAGAFGTALAIALARTGQPVGLWARDPGAARTMGRTRVNQPYLPDAILPETVSVSAEIGDFFASDILLLAIPMTALSALLATLDGPLRTKALVACAKGIDIASGCGPAVLITRALPGATVAVLTGPSFAADIARGLPTALTLACADDAAGTSLQVALSTSVLRLYRTTDVTGAELGGALKNVIAIAAGIAIGAGLGESARASLITRGFVEMTRFAVARGARAETLAGLSGLGDLILTCTSVQSRNYRFGAALGGGQGFDSSITVEGTATARAVAALVPGLGFDMPVTSMIAALIDGSITLREGIETLLSRPLRKE